MGFTLFILGDKPLSSLLRTDKTVPVTILRMEEPKYQHYRLVTDDGTVLNYDHEPEAFADLCSRGFPLKTEVMVDAEGRPVIPSPFSSMIPGIVLAILLFLVLNMTWIYRSSEENPQRRRLLIRNGVLVQCVLLIAGNVLVPLCDFWSPWLLLGLGPIAVSVAALFERRWLSTAVWMALWLAYPCATLVSYGASWLGPAETIPAKKVFLQFGFEDRRISKKNRGSWTYTVQTCTSLLTYSWQGKPRYFYVKLEDYVDDLSNENSPEEYRQDAEYMSLLNSFKPFPLLVRANGDVPAARLPKPCRQEREERKVRWVMSGVCAVIALVFWVIYKTRRRLSQ